VAKSGKKEAKLFMGKYYKALSDFCRDHKALSWLLFSFAFLIFIFFLLDLSVRKGYWAHIPSDDELQGYTFDTASEIYSIDGELLGKYYIRDRSLVELSALPLHLKEALIATEDARFYDHNGVDVKSLFRVFFKSLLGGDSSAGGGSTLSQQLAKQWFPRRDYPFMEILINKLREMEVARRLEKLYSKEEIILHYLNTVFLGENAYGIQSASLRYFQKNCDNLSMEEAATLVGMLKAPSYYNPRLRPMQARFRRNTVLRQMEKYGYLSTLTADSLVALPLVLNYHTPSHHEGPAPYFRAYLRQILNEWADENPKPDGSKWNIYKDGLKIYTPIHSEVQAYAEQAVREEMEGIQKKFDREWRGKRKKRLAARIFEDKKSLTPYYRRWKERGYSDAAIDSLFRVKRKISLFTYEGEADTLMSLRDSIIASNFLLQAGFCALDPSSGFIRAWVGGLDHRYYQFDHVLSRRQAGSAFKPLVYATALEKGIDPCSFTSNEQTTYARYGNWSPSNADKLYGGEYSMEGALTHSVNVVAVKMVMEVGPSSVCEMAKRMGVPYPLPEVPSIALGSAEIALQDLLSIYGSIANRGKKIRPRLLVRIESPEGDILYDATRTQVQPQVIEAEHAEMLLQMLRGVVDEGTAKGLRSKYGLKLDLAGKTGTTQKQTDGWFVGTMPYLAAAAWVGADDQRVHFRTMAGQGATTALPIYGRFMQLLLADKEFKSYRKARFAQPSAEIMARLDCPAFNFPFNVEDFREWWISKYGEEDSLYFDGTLDLPPQD